MEKLFYGILLTKNALSLLIFLLYMKILIRSFCRFFVKNEQAARKRLTGTFNPRLPASTGGIDEFEQGLRCVKFLIPLPS